MVVEVNVVLVFANEEGKFGNPVGIVSDILQVISSEKRQKIIANLGFSESVFIENFTSGKVSIFNPIKEVRFAGHALIGTAYFISHMLSKPISFLECKGGKVQFWQEDRLTWIHASLTGTPPWHHEQLQNSTEIENLTSSQTTTKKHTMVWAWIDEKRGIIRARTFAPDWGIPEDQGNGSGSMQLATILDRSLEIHHGEGSVIYAKPAENDFADVGGMVKGNLSREITL